MEQTRQKEIEYVHDQAPFALGFVRDEGIMDKAILSQSNTYTNLYAFRNDFERLCADKKIKHIEYITAINDLYLLALILMTDESYNELMKEEQK